MPASQAASRTPGTTGIVGQPRRRKRRNLCRRLGHATLPEAPMAGISIRSAAYCLGRAPERSLSTELLISGSMYSICALPLKSAGDLLGLLVDHGRHDPVLHRLEGRRRTLAAVVDLDDVPAELGLERLADLALLQLEGGLLELRHHLAATEEAELAALVLRAGVLGDSPWPAARNRRRARSSRQISAPSPCCRPGCGGRAPPPRASRRRPGCRRTCLASASLIGCP